MRNFTRNLIAAATITLFSAFSGSPLLAQTADQPAASGPGPHPGFHQRFVFTMQDRGARFRILMGSLHLTPAQQSQVRQIAQTHEQQAAALQRQLHQIRSQLGDKLLGAATPTAADLAPLERQAAQLQRQLDHNIVETALALRGVLTQDQINHVAQVHRQLASLRAQMKKLIGDQSGADMIVPK